MQLVWLSLGMLSNKIDPRLPLMGSNMNQPSSEKNGQPWTTKFSDDRKHTDGPVVGYSALTFLPGVRSLAWYMCKWFLFLLCASGHLSYVRAGGRWFPMARQTPLACNQKKKKKNLMHLSRFFRDAMLRSFWTTWARLWVRRLQGQTTTRSAGMK